MRRITWSLRTSSGFTMIRRSTNVACAAILGATRTWDASGDGLSDSSKADESSSTSDLAGVAKRTDLAGSFGTAADIADCARHSSATNTGRADDELILTLSNLIPTTGLASPGKYSGSLALGAANALTLDFRRLMRMLSESPPVFVTLEAATRTSSLKWRARLKRSAYSVPKMWWEDHHHDDAITNRARSRCVRRRGRAIACRSSRPHRCARWQPWRDPSTGPA